MKVEINEIAKKKRYMYIGPSLRKNSLKNGQVFIEEENKVFKDVSEKNSSLKKLYVEVDHKMSTKIANTKKEGTVENVTYKKIEEWVKDGEK